MLNSIKSLLIFKKIFSFLVEKKKLKIIKYSKKVQKKLDISMENYRLISGKYIIGNKNGICKVYDYQEHLIFEGEYINGKKHGKGKEFNKYGELLFEGDYLNDKKWNGKGYYIDIKKYCDDNNYRIENERGEKFDNSNIYYEMKEGKGLMIDYDDEEYIFEGEYLNGERNGYGRDYKLFKNSLFIYEGEYLNGKRNGKGKEYVSNDIQSAIGGSNKLIFEGEYFCGKRWKGKGYDGNRNIVYEVKNGVGYIKEYYYHNVIFEGQYINGEKNGKGIEFKFNNDPTIFSNERFEGNYVDGKKHGLGKVCKEKDIIVFQGLYLYNHKIKGTEYYNDGKIKYEGEYFFDQKWNGKGYDKDGNVIYEINNGTGKIKEYFENDKIQLQGELLNGKGDIKIYDKNEGLIYEGGYINGEKNGRGKEYDMNIYAKLECSFDGYFLNNKRWYGFGKETFGNFLYIGVYSNGQITGNGQLYWKNGNIISSGVYLNGKRWGGEGKEFLFSNSLYTGYHMIFLGEYLNGVKHGKGLEFYLNNKTKFEGEYLNGLKWNGIEYGIYDLEIYEIKNGNGFIREYDYNGNIIFEGEYLNGRRWNGNINFKNLSIYPIKDGKGFIKEYKYISNNEEIIFEGEYVNGQKNGKGKEYNNYLGLNYLEFEGEYLDGLKHGIGKTFCNGNLLFEGEYSNGKIKIIKSGKIQENQEI